MAMTKAEVRRAFREAMAADYADVPAKEALNHTFSPEFYAKMDALIAEQKRGSWRLLSRQTRRALVAAVILAASLLLVACTPRLREAVSEFVVTVYETFVRFTSDSDLGLLRTEIEMVYELNPIPDGFKIVSREQSDPYSTKTVYKNAVGDYIAVTQDAVTGTNGTTDSEIKGSFAKRVGQVDALLWYTTTSASARMFYDGYYFHITYYGSIEPMQFESIIISLQLEQ